MTKQQTAVEGGTRTVTAAREGHTRTARAGAEHVAPAAEGTPHRSDAPAGPASHAELTRFVDRYGDLIDDRVAEIVEEIVDEVLTAREARRRRLSGLRLCLVVAALCGVSVLLRETPYAVAAAWLAGAAICVRGCGS
ncbi:hypothetical protein [Streptomyces shaanxiensis]|uniref:DUF3040 domain-containing protein n=1 Tax=Streptomyces shaanxiensis TaxID=653357 RepID=A0ABP7VWZ1_9ACTN